MSWPAHWQPNLWTGFRKRVGGPDLSFFFLYSNRRQKPQGEVVSLDFQPFLTLKLPASPVSQRFSTATLMGFVSTQNQFETSIT